MHMRHKYHLLFFITGLFLQDPHVDVFRMDDLEQELGLNREKLVAMAILLGCDYMPQGVPGVGRELAGKLMQALDGVEVLKRLVNNSDAPKN